MTSCEDRLLVGINQANIQLASKTMKNAGAARLQYNFGVILVV